MSRLILHVGTHKTGTSSVQSVLYANRLQLAGSGIIYPEPYFGVEHHSLIGSLQELAPAYLPPSGRMALWQAMADSYAASDACVIISSEMMSVAAAARPEFLTEVVQIIERFDELVVVCFFRNQVSYFQAGYLEKSKKRQPMALVDRVSKLLNLQNGSDRDLNHGRLYTRFKQVFGARSICALSYEAHATSPTGVLDAILSRTGHSVRANDLGDLSDLGSNRSPDPLATYVARQVFDVPVLHPSMIGYARTALDRLYGEGHPSTLLTRTEIVALKEVFGASNRQFDDELVRDGHAPLSLPFPDWSEYIHREDLHAGYWLELARLMAVALP